MGNHLSTRAGSNRKTLGKLEVAREKPGTVDFNPLSWKCSSSAPPLPRSTVFFFLFSQSYPIFPGWFSSFSTARRICHLIRRQLLCISDCIFFFFISPCTLHIFCQYPRRHLVFMALGDCLWDQDKPHQHRLYFVYAEHPACSSVQPPEWLILCIIGRTTSREDVRKSELWPGELHNRISCP